MKSVLKTLGRVLIVILITLVLVVGALAGLISILTHGPSDDAKRLFTLSCNETSAMKWLPGLFISEEEEQAILNPPPAEEIKSELPDFTYLDYEDQSERVEEEQPLVTVTEVDDNAAPEDYVEIEDVKGATFKGKLMIVKDPSKVIVGTLDRYGANYSGLLLEDFINKYDAAGGVNAGGFEDTNGMGNGGVPHGIVMKDGAFAWGSASGYYNNVIGFDGDHILHTGTYTGQQCLDMGLVSAVSFPPGPTLIQDGVKLENLGGGMNPRTALGQRSDGSVLILVVEGRKPDSLGATYDDLANILFEKGCVNAGSLDGGSSSVMYFQGEQLTRSSNVVGQRKLPDCILVLK